MQVDIVYVYLRMESNSASSVQRPNCYLAYDEEGNTQIVKNPYDISMFNHNFISIHYSKELPSQQPKLFQDHDFYIKDQPLRHLQDEEVVIKRISELYPTTLGQSLFPLHKQTHEISQNNSTLPHFVYEMRQFDVVIFKRLFITQHVSKEGRYEVIVNRDGYFQVQIVDDYIPVRAKSQRPIWQLDSRQPWQLILAKLWAKRLGAYHQIKFAKPFEFIQYFTPCTWRYFNLAKEGRQFLANYSQKVGKTCKILLKTKFQPEVEKAGLISGQVGYELIELDEFIVKDKKEYNLLIKSVVPHQWTGSLSIFDQQFSSVFKRLNNAYQLDSTLLMNQPDFFNFFSRAYVTKSHTNFPQFINCYSFIVPKNNKNPYFLKFSTLSQGYLILTIRQGDDNKKKIDSQPNFKKMNYSSFKSSFSFCDAGWRFLEIKYMLSKQNYVRSEEPKDWVSSQIQRKRREETKLSPGKEQKQFRPLQYTLEDFDYTRGRNKGEAHPIEIGPGTYFIRLLPERAEQQSTFTIQCISHENIVLNNLQIDAQAQLSIIKDTLLSVSHSVPTQYLAQKVSISFGQQFQSIGYGFIAVQTEKSLQGTLVISVDPIVLMKDGYKLKLEFQGQKQAFRLQLSGYESEVFVLQRFSEGVKEYIWPPNAFKFYMSQR